jgi:hypothetical protein
VTRARVSQSSHTTLLAEKSQCLPIPHTRIAMADKRKAPPGDRPSKKRKPEIIWGPSNNEPSGSSRVPPSQPKVNVKSTSISIHQTGHASTRTAYVSLDASPKKTVPLPQPPEIHWNKSPPEDPSAKIDELYEDPKYVDHVENISVFPKKRKRTASVSGWDLVSPNLSDLALSRTTPLEHSSPILTNTSTNSCVWRDDVVI